MKYLLAAIGGLVAIANIGFNTPDARAFAIASLVAIPLASRIPLSDRPIRERYLIASGLTCIGAILVLIQAASGQQRLLSELIGLGIAMWAINSLAIWAVVRVVRPDWMKGAKEGDRNV